MISQELIDDAAGDRAVREAIERIANYVEEDAQPPTFTVFIAQRSSLIAKEPEFCRHTIATGKAEVAAFLAIEECRLNVYDEVMVAEVFAHEGQEFRYKYQLMPVGNE